MLLVIAVGLALTNWHLYILAENIADLENNLTRGLWSVESQVSGVSKQVKQVRYSVDEASDNASEAASWAEDAYYSSFAAQCNYCP